MDFSSIDIFCHRVDNYGDLGVAYRFAKELKIARPAWRVRAFFDDLAALREIADEIDPDEVIQERNSIVYVKSWALSRAQADALGAADVMVEMFACDIPEPFMEMAYDNSILIINLEYLSAEEWVEGYHLKESLLGRGSVRKFFFLPGFRETTGGLIINSRLRDALESGSFDRYAVINDILDKYGLNHIKPEDNQLIGTIFTYERGFDLLLAHIGNLECQTTLLVFGEKSRRGMSATLGRLGIDVVNVINKGGQRANEPCQCQYYIYKNVQIIYMPFVNQHAYDTLLCCTGFNIVRGEDSLARAALSGKPFIWNAYIQNEKYQNVKVEALLKTLRPYFDDENLFAAYSDLMTKFNDAPAESPEQTTSERYDIFFKNLKKLEHASERIYYFMLRNCDLVSNFCTFLDGYQADYVSIDKQ